MTPPAATSGRSSGAARPEIRRGVGMASAAGTQRDRHGRGPRSPLLPSQLPGFRTRSELFDQVVMDAVADLENTWPNRLTQLEFAVDDVPSIPQGLKADRDDLVVDDGVPLSRFYPPGVDGRGKPTKARIVVYRRPLEMRAPVQPELLDLVTEVLAQQITAVLGEGEGEN